MPNWCSYTMKAVSKSKDALDRLIKIMTYEDKEYYIYRCASVGVSDEVQEGDYFVAMVYGDVAWSCLHGSIESKESMKLLIQVVSITTVTLIPLLQSTMPFDGSRTVI